MIYCSVSKSTLDALKKKKNAEQSNKIELVMELLC